jgi:cytochrome P450
MKLAVHVIFAAGYGYSFDWDGNDKIWKGHKMHFKDALSSIIGNLITFVAVPRLLFKLLPLSHFQKVDQAYNETKIYFKELIDIEKSSELSTTSGRTILNALVHADQKGEVFTEDEIMGNIFFFFLAGHETTYCAQLFKLTQCKCAHEFALSHSITPRSSRYII